MGEARAKVRRVTALITEKISYKPFGATTTHHVAVCDCGKWESSPWDKIGIGQQEGMTREVWNHVAARHLGCRHEHAESPTPCRCGNYIACCSADLDEHVCAMLSDAANHG